MARTAQGLDHQDGRGLGEGAPLRPSQGTSTRRRLAARCAALATLCLCLALAGGTASARDDGRAPGATPDSLVTNDQSRAISDALDWIAKNQQTSGAWGDERATQIVDTSLSLLALMAGGNTLGPGVADRDGIVSGPTMRGAYAASVQKGLDFLARRACSDEAGVPAGYIGGDANSQMHGHGFATLALATGCANLAANRVDVIAESVKRGVAPSALSFADRVRWGVQRAVRLIEATQDKEYGGWSYQPRESGHEGSMTVTQITAMRAAMAAGVAVNGTVMKNALTYVRKSQNTQSKDFFGGFAYQIDKPTRVSYALTAAALTTFFGLGRYGDQPGDKDVIENGLRFMDRRFEEEAFSTHEQWYYYRLFYAAQALYLSGDEARRAKYWPRIRDEVLKWSDHDGSFRSKPDSQRSAEYCTAMGCLILQVPTETLPIFQRR